MDKSKPQHPPNAPPLAQPPRTLAQRLLHEWLLPIAAVVAIMSPIRASIADWNDVPTGSMKPTILEGDRIYVNKLAFGLRIPFTHTWLARWSSPVRGDIITFASPMDGTRLVKRVIGLPGDIIELRDNRLLVNQTPADFAITAEGPADLFPGGPQARIVQVTEAFAGMSHAISITPGLPSIKDFAPTLVPEGHVFVLGDNRDMSSDSRIIGPVPIRSIYGRSPGVALSLDPGHSYTPRWDRFFSTLK